MKERKPLFPEYIWIFFVGLLLAIIICMRLLPGQAAFYEEPQLNNVIYVRIAGKTLYFGDTDCDPATAVINENGSTWTDALISDINYNLVLLNAKFGVGNFSVFIIDDYAVTYCYEKLAALLHANNIYCYGYVSEVQTGTTSDGEPYTIWASPWNYSYAQTYWTQYYNYNTFILSDFTIGYYTQIDEYVSPTPSLSPTPTPVPEEYNILISYTNSGNTTTYYKLYCLTASGFKDSFEHSNVSGCMSYVLSEHSLSAPFNFSGACFVNGTTTGYYSYTRSFLYFTADSVSGVVYDIGSSLPTTDFDVLKENYTPTSLSSYVNGDTAFQLGYDSSYPNTFCLYLVNNGYNFSLIKTDFIYTEISFSGSYIGTSQAFHSDYNENYLSCLNGYSGLLGYGSEVDNPDVSPTPTISPTPTQAPYVEVILPSPTPGPTAPVSFNDSDLPGGASGAGGSISSNDGASSSTADGVYNYWSYVLSQNQALAFIASFFQILPFELVYSLGSLIFILILIAMARLFIHFIE